MAYSILQTAEGAATGAGTTVSSASFTPTAGSTLVALVAAQHTSDLSSFTFTLADTSGGNDTWSEAGSGNSTGILAVDACYHWYILTSAAATATVVQATASASIGYGRIILVFEISGLDAAPYLAASYNPEPTPGTTTDFVDSGLTGTLASQPALLLGLSYNSDGVAGAPNTGTGYTSIGTFWTALARAEHKRVTVTDSDDATWTAVGNNNHYSTVIALKESTAAASAPKRALLLGVG